MFGGGDGESAWRPMLTQAIAKQMAAHGGIGLAVPVLRQILIMQETSK
jgi:Rod binding domain-containing protein